MTDQIDSSLHWTSHFARYGYAILRQLVSPAFCERAVDRVCERLGAARPLTDWTAGDVPVLHQPFYEGWNEPDPVLGQIIDQPRLAAAVAALHGRPGKWNRRRDYYLFLKPYEPNAEARLTPRGHIDFKPHVVPPLFRGFTMQVALAETEPFGGNLTVHPGSHIQVQRVLLTKPEVRQTGHIVESIPDLKPPVEFVAQPGDVLFMHHLMVHSGNPCHGERRLPRIALHVEAFRDAWFNHIDPSRPYLSPWKRSLAFNGVVDLDPAIKAAQIADRQAYLEGLRDGKQPTTY